MIKQSGYSGHLLQQHIMPLSSQNTGSRPWLVTPQEKAQYDSIFRLWDPQGTGFIPGIILSLMLGDRARQVFMQSGLPDAMLAHIW
jgi:hypothetical protein